MTEDAIADHQAMIMGAFVRLLQAERLERDAKLEIKALEEKHASTIRHAQAEQMKAWEAITTLMAETGEVEVILPDETNDYKIAFNTPPETVDAPDVGAVPAEWLKVETTVKKKELLDHLKKLRESGEPMPNWATLKRGPAKLGYKLIKKAAA